MGVSMGSHQDHPATTPKSIETFRVCTAFCADHFGNKFVRVWPCFRIDIGQILFMPFYALCVFMQKIEVVAYRKNDDNSSLVARILKPITDSDSS